MVEEKSLIIDKIFNIVFVDFEGLQKNLGDQTVMTAHVKMVLGHLEAWFQEEHKKPFLLVGPSGCGKK